MKNEIIEKAKIIIQKNRQSAIVENDRRIEEINNKIPEINEINKNLFYTGKKIIDIVIAGKQKFKTQEQIKKEIEKIKQNNLDKQKKSEELLVKNGYPADYLDIHYSCEKCCDTGYTDIEMCSCLRKLCEKLEADEINRHSHLELSSFDTFSLSYYTDKDLEIMQKHFCHLKEYAENFTPDSRSIFMYGKTGLGKTHLSLAIADTVLKKGHSVIYDSVINILAKIEEENFSYNHKREMLNLVLKTDLLIMDDLGTEHGTTFYDSTVYNIINTRLNYHKPVIISTNLDIGEIRERYDERITSRITTQYDVIEFCGKDIRWQKKEQKGNRP